jgi:signal transduction histidine kinase/integral membrane sensor domain MASE1
MPRHLADGGMRLAGTVRALPDAKRCELLGKIALLAVLYYVTGKLGLLLAVPPGYATVIWPPSGIATGMLIVHGPRLWPGILIGSFFLNAPISGAVADDISANALLIAGLIASGSACQALFGREIVVRMLRLPLELTRLKDMLILFALSGPLACLIASTVGVSTLYVMGSLPAERIVENWLTWWAGDSFGVAVFLPLMLIAPGSPRRFTWRGQKVTPLPILAMLTLLLLLGLTFYAWKLISENHRQSGLAEFETLALESEKALQHRLQSYAQALLGADGLIRAAPHFSRISWRHYVNAINARENFPGINGIGYIADVKLDDVAEFLRVRRQEDSPDFAIHPQTEQLPLFVISYIEPREINKQAVGLNIAFEENRRAAAILARDSGKAAITKRILLVQDETKSPGFLLLHPVYARDTAFDTVEARRAVFRGWIYAPFVGQNFMRDLTPSQGAMLNLSVYDGEAEDPRSLIYASQMSEKSGTPGFRVSKKLHLMQQNWTLVWTSTPAYEAAETSRESDIVLIAGLVFTALVGAFLSVLARRSEIIQRLVAEQTNLMKIQHAELIGAQQELWHINENLELRVAERTADLQEARKVAEAASRVKSDFLSNISHELRTPMHAILNCAKIGMTHLQEGNSQKIQKYLNNIRMSGERLSALLNDLLELSRMEAGKVSLKLQRCNLLEIIQISLAELETLKAEKNINLILHSSAENPSTLCDRQQILQVFINLYSNAIKYSPVGGTIGITIADAETAQGAPALLCTVEDQGIGIPANELEMVFDKFVQSSKTRTGAGGTGLGLAICKEIVELHKGKIWAENGPAGGARLQVLVNK